MNLESAEKTIHHMRRKVKPMYPMLTFDGQMHGRLRDVFEKMWTRAGRTEIVPSDRVGMVCWDEWDAPTLRTVVERVRELKCEVLYIKEAGKRHHHDAVAELEALRLLGDPQVGLVLVGEMEIFLRCAILANLREDELDREEIGQELIDLAHRQGLKTGTVVA